MSTPDWDGRIIGWDVPRFSGTPKCKNEDPDVFFPNTSQESKEVKQLCHSCPVEAECLEWALARSERFGIWGGTDPAERRNIRKKRGMPQPPPRRIVVARHGTPSGLRAHLRKGETPCPVCRIGERTNQAAYNAGRTGPCPQCGNWMQVRNFSRHLRESCPKAGA